MIIFCLLNINQLVVNITVTLLLHLETKIVLRPTLMHRYFGKQINLNKDKTEILVIGAPNMTNALVKDNIKVAN